MYVQSGTWIQVSDKLLWGCRCGHIRSTMYTTQAVFSEQSSVKPHSAALVDVARNPLVVIWYWIDFLCFTVRSLSIICVDFPSPVLRKTLSNWKNRVWNTLTLKSKFWFLQFPVCLVLAELYIFSESHFPYLFHGDDNTPPARRRLCEITLEMSGNKMY